MLISKTLDNSRIGYEGAVYIIIPKGVEPTDAMVVSRKQAEANARDTAQSWADQCAEVLKWGQHLSGSVRQFLGCQGVFSCRGQWSHHNIDDLARAVDRFDSSCSSSDTASSTSSVAADKPAHTSQ